MRFRGINSCTKIHGLLWVSLSDEFIHERNQLCLGQCQYKYNVKLCVRLPSCNLSNICILNEWEKDALYEMYYCT